MRDLEDMPKIRLTKLKEVDDPTHPNNIEEGYFREGLMVADPEVGKPFIVGFNFKTSIVREVMEDNKFRTLNSIYQIEYL